MSKLGIMQGRLLPQGQRFQEFPGERWEEEFALAAKTPLSYIEWIYDLPSARTNPLLNDIIQVTGTISRTNTAIPALCVDYFMEKTFFGVSANELTQTQRVLEQLIRVAGQVGIQRIVIPCVDSSRIRSEENVEALVRVLQEALPTAKTERVGLHLETDLGPKEFARLLDRVPEESIKVNYDSGNSASLGYTPADELGAYGERIGSLHIKDRVRGGGTVPLGTGDADFPALFRSLEKIEYRGDITLQVARSVPGEELEWARTNRAFVARHWTLE